MQATNLSATTQGSDYVPLKLEAKTAIAALAVESFNYRKNVHVNIVTDSASPTLSVFIYVHGKSEQCITIDLSNHDHVEQLDAALKTVRLYKNQHSIILPLHPLHNQWSKQQ